MCCCQTRWGQTPRRGDKQRREKENVFCLPTEQRARLGLKLSNLLRRLPYSQPSLCVQVQRESKCERPKQTLKASWVGVKGWRDGQAAGRRKADIQEKPRQLSVLVPKGQEGPSTQTVLSGQTSPAGFALHGRDGQSGEPSPLQILPGLWSLDGV